jgi:hypothetical protein
LLFFTDARIGAGTATYLPEPTSSLLHCLAIFKLFPLSI